VGTPVTHLFGVNLQTPDVQLIGNNTDTIYQSHYAKVHILKNPWMSNSMKYYS